MLRVLAIGLRHLDQLVTVRCGGSAPEAVLDWQPLSVSDFGSKLQHALLPGSAHADVVTLPALCVQSLVLLLADHLLQLFLYIPSAILFGNPNTHDHF